VPGHGRSKSAPSIVKANVSNWCARLFSVIQHETDHPGVLFFDRMRSLESLTFPDEYSRHWTKD
jgi:peptide deformylase